MKILPKTRGDSISFAPAMQLWMDIAQAVAEVGGFNSISAISLTEYEMRLLNRFRTQIPPYEIDGTREVMTWSLFESFARIEETA